MKKGSGISFAVMEQERRGLLEEKKEHPWMSESLRKRLVNDHLTLHPYMYRK